MMTTNQILTRENIVEMLATKDKAICRALVVLRNNQTADERTDEATKHHNGKGFRPAHAKKGTGMANFYLSSGFLSPKQIAYWRRPNAKGEMRISIYWRQLIAAAEAKSVAAQASETSFAYGHNVAK